MRRILQDLKVHLRSDADWKTYSSTGLFLALLIFLNYYFEFETAVLAKLSSWGYLLFFLSFFPFVYFTSVWIKAGKTPFQNREFLISSGLFLLLLSFTTGFTFQRTWLSELPKYEYYFSFNLSMNVIGSFFILIPLYIFYRAKDRQHLGSFYGLTFKQHDFKPYLFLLALMVPVLMIATTQEDFMRTYPMFKWWNYQEAFGLSQTQMAWIFEFVYLFDFIRVEALFRGALIIGLSRFLGKDAILPMVALYCVLHFNKPLGETVSSIFGGYILGTIALYQRNIVGGCLIHIGIAGLMDLAAIIAR